MAPSLELQCLTVAVEAQLLALMRAVLVVLERAWEQIQECLLQVAQKTARELHKRLRVPEQQARGSESAQGGKRQAREAMALAWGAQSESRASRTAGSSQHLLHQLCVLLQAAPEGSMKELVRAVLACWLTQIEVMSQQEPAQRLV